uniref:L1 transposable element RRM domain-containing protein n=1 Tax=Monodon monoceros TaxID=40151 RepID=A0A8C6BMI7_MONMO
MKEQGKNAPDQTNEEEIGSLPEKEFRVIIVKMIEKLGNRMEKIQETFNKELQELKSKQTMMNKKINEIKNSLEGINSRLTDTEEWIGELEDKLVEITTAEQNKEKRMTRIEDSHRDLWDNIKHTNIRIIVVPDEKGTGKIFEEIMVENFRNMGKDIVNQVQGAQRVPYRINPRRNTPKHILIKLSKIKYKEQILKAAKGKQQITYKGIPVKLTADLSAETLQARRDWQDIFKVMKEKNLQPRLLYTARISFRFDGQIKTFTDKQKLKNSAPPNQLYKQC